VPPIRGLGRWKGATHEGSAEACPPPGGSPPFLKVALPTRIPSITRDGSHTPCKLARNGRSQTAAHGACNRPSVTSTPPSSPKPAVERANRHAGGVQPHNGCAPFRLHRIRWVSVKARARMSCNRRNGYCVHGNRTTTCANAAPSRLRNRCRDSRQPCAWPNSANRAQRSRVSQPREEARRLIWPKVDWQ
jgi:hypothetical protein